MSSALWNAELIGLLAGGLNIVSTFPQILAELRNSDRGARDMAHIKSRLLQLLANLLWFAYAVSQQLPSVALMTGIMALCLMLVIGQLWRRPADR